MRARALILFLSLFSCWVGAEDCQRNTGRLLVNIDPKAPFSSEDFASSTSAQLISIDPRNPFLAFDRLYFDRPFVVLSTFLEEKLLQKLANDNGYRCITFVDESLESATIRARDLWASIPKKSSEIPSLNIEESKRMYSLMDKIDKVFTKNNILYWAGGGTLLGAVRHEGLIPWDDDLDLYMLDSDVNRLTQIENDLEAAGLKLHYYFKDTYKIFENTADPIPDPKDPEKILPFGYPAADIFTVALQRRNEKNDLYVLKSRIFYWEWNSDCFTYSQIQNIYRAPFGPLMIPIPGDPERNLNLLYGTSEIPDLWKTYASEPNWDHSRELRLKDTGALVKIDDFSPAPWE